MALKKASKRITISDGSVNSFGFRTLTDGIDLNQYNKNPVMLWMHYRANKGTKDEVLPLGIVTDLKVANDALTGMPEFDDTDEFAMKLYEKFEAGIIRMSSAGLKPIEFSGDKKLLLPNQKLPTLVKSELKEISLADIGSNDNALSYSEVVLYDNDDHIIDLNEKSILTLINLNKKHMDLTVINLTDVAPLLGLSDTATSKDVLTAVNKLKTDKEAVEVKLAEVLKLHDGEKIETLVSAAVETKKITAAQKPHFIKLAGFDFETAKATLDSMPAYVSLKDQVKEGGIVEDKEVSELVKLSGEQLWREGKLDILRLKSPEQYKIKYKEFFGKDAAE